MGVTLADTDWGASLEAWHHWSERLGLTEHLLPVVANPNAPISEDSKVKTLGKTPTKYNFRGEAAGFPKWTKHIATHREVAKWELERDYGICVQARAVRAIDIDVGHRTKSRLIVEAIERVLPFYQFPRRYREATGKVLLPFLYKGPMPKRMIPVDGGIIEFLGDGQQWIAESTYIDAKSGKANGRYLWLGGWPTELPELTEGELELVWETLIELFATGEPTQARVRREGKDIDARPRPGLEDEVAQWILEGKWELRDDPTIDRLYIRCPFEKDHSSDSGPTETVYYIAGTGGYERGHFKCLHAHCQGHDDGDFLREMGYSQADFPELEPEDDEPGTEIEVSVPKAEKRYICDDKGRRECNSYNLVQFLSDPEETGRIIAWDEFTAQIIWAPVDDPTRWKVWHDADYVAVSMRMDNRGFKPHQPSTLRPHVLFVARRNLRDMAIEWSKTLPEWDGVKRIERFLPDYLHTPDTRYERAVGRYLWTAHAGRLLDPGCKADMALIWYGRQGSRKSTAVELMSPSPDMFVAIKATGRDDDTARKMRGRLVVELGELAGFKGREVEDIKEWIAKKVEEWTPKYQEFGTKFKRRCLLHGTTNIDNILNDPTGARRFLPITVCYEHLIEAEVPEGGPVVCETDRIKADRDQLWAEAIAVWREQGVLYAEAEQLARGEHYKYEDVDNWVDAVARWMTEEDPMTGKAPCERPYEWGVDDALAGALGKPKSHITRADQSRVGGLLTKIGCRKKRVWDRGWRYAAPKGMEKVAD